MSGRCAEIFQVRTSTSSIVNSGDEDFSKDQCKRERERERERRRKREAGRERESNSDRERDVCMFRETDEETKPRLRGL